MNLNKLLNPKTIALVGISQTNQRHPANIIYQKNQNKKSAEIFLVSPKGGFYNNQKLYTSIKEIPKKIDAVVLVIRAEHVPEALKDAIDAKTSGAIIISGGFSEAGNHELQNEITEIAKAHNYPFIGPNGLGIYSPPLLNTLFFTEDRFVNPHEGNISLISQSGGVLVDAIISFTHENIGLSRVISIGNKARVDEVDLLKFLSKDEDTKVIGIYSEGFPKLRGRDFIEELQRCKKPVVIWKAGKTPASKAAISSHTAAIAGDYKTFSEVIKSTEAYEVDTMPEFLSACEALSYYDKASIKNIGIITMSGGHGVITSDFCFNAGFNIPQFEKQAEQKLLKNISDPIKKIGSFVNPIDLTGSAVDDDYYESVKFSLEQNNLDALLILFLPFIPAMTSALPGRICDLIKNSTKPVVCYVPQLPKFDLFTQCFECGGIPVSHTLEGSITMLKALRKSS